MLPYDVAHPAEQWILPQPLKEVSGIAVVNKNHFIAIEDLHPWLYLLRMDGHAVVEKTIAFEQTDKAKMDIEDVALQGDIVYALWSHGAIFQIKNWDSTPATKKFVTALSKDENTEGLCYDPVTKKLLIACKESSLAETGKKSTKAIYSFNINKGKLDEHPFLLLRKKDFKNAGSDGLSFYPSAIAVQPVTKDIYILSSKENKCLAVYGRDGNLKSFTMLDKTLLPQPEGLCFTADETLYISTQGRHGQPPKIYAFAKVNS